MERINFEYVVKSFFLGIFIGVILQLNLNVTASASDRFIMILASGGIGFVIGFITEWLTSLLPISLANSRNYFFINIVIALVVTTLIVSLAMLVTGRETGSIREFIPILAIVLSIVFIANIIEYILYRRAQNKLGKFKKLLKD